MQVVDMDMVTNILFFIDTNTQMEQQNTSLQEILESFVDEVMQGMMLEGVDPEQKIVIRELISNRVDKRLMSLILQELPEEHFQALLEGVGEQDLSQEQEMEIMGEAIDHIPDFLPKMVETLGALQTELTADAAKLYQSTQPPDTSSL